MASWLQTCTTMHFPIEFPKNQPQGFKSRPFCLLVELVTDGNKLSPFPLIMTLNSRLELKNQSNLYFTLLNWCFMPLPQGWDCYTVGGLEQQAISPGESWLEAREGRVWAGFEGLGEFNWNSLEGKPGPCALCAWVHLSLWTKAQSCKKISVRDWSPGLRKERSNSGEISPAYKQCAASLDCPVLKEARR